MNDKALYQLERAVDALKLMAEALREEHNKNYDTISFNDVPSGDVVIPTAWNDDVITIDKSTLYDLVKSSGNIEINTGSEGSITFS